MSKFFRCQHGVRGRCCRRDATSLGFNNFWLCTFHYNRWKKRQQSGILYCARCGDADTSKAAKLRKFHTGFSACCNDNLVKERPRSRYPPKVFAGNPAHGVPIK